MTNPEEPHPSSEFDDPATLPPSDTTSPAPEPPASGSSPPFPKPASSAPSGRARGFLTGRNLAFLGGGAVVAVVVVALAVLFTMVIVGGDGGRGGGSSDPLAYILDDSDDMDLAVINVAAILQLEDIPSELYSGPLEMPYDKQLDHPEDWKDEWRDSDWGRSMPVPSWFFSPVVLDDVSTLVVQEVDGDTGYILAGNFLFDAIRDAMDDEGWEEDSYREFEVWNDRNVALLEDSGIILLGEGFVGGVLKGLDTGKGLLEGNSAMQRALDKAGTGLLVLGNAGNCQSLGAPRLRGCDAYAWSITGGTPATTLLRAAYLFSSTSRAEASSEDIEEAIFDADDVDADIESMKVEGDFVTYELTIHED